MSASPAETAACPNCGADVPAGARFCPACGTRLEDGSTAVIPPPPDETGRVPVSVTEAKPHLFGVTPPLALLVLAGSALLLGVLLFVLGRGPAGVVLVALGIVWLGVFALVSSGERSRRLRERARASATAYGARSSARREATRLRHELGRLESERGERLRAFAEAAYAGSDGEAGAARAELVALDERIAERRRELELLGPRVEEQVARARLEVQPTESVRLPQERDPEQD